VSRDAARRSSRPAIPTSADHASLVISALNRPESNRRALVDARPEAATRQCGGPVARYHEVPGVGVGAVARYHEVPGVGVAGEESSRRAPAVDGDRGEARVIETSSSHGKYGASPRVMLVAPQLADVGPAGAIRIESPSVANGPVRP
jgi:hypothetical protein